MILSTTASWNRLLSLKTYGFLGLLSTQPIFFPHEGVFLLNDPAIKALLTPLPFLSAPSW